MNKPITRSQRKAIFALWQRLSGPNTTDPVRWDPGAERWIRYREFRKRFYYSTTFGCVIGPWCGMVVGIEDDGHTHS